MTNLPEITSDGMEMGLAGCRALIVFSGKTEVWWLRILRPGFRHCYVLIESYGNWLVYNPASHRTDIHVVGAYPYADLVHWLFTQECTVAGYRISHTPKRCAPIRPYTCVEAIKRLLGIRAAGIFTPWQLYLYLTENTA